MAYRKLMQGIRGLPGGVSSSLLLPVMVAVVTVAFAGCEGVLEIEDTENVTGDALEGNTRLLVNRAFTDFQVAYSGGGLDDKVLSVSALMSDEFLSAGTFTTRTATDQREQFPSQSGNTSDAAYGDLHDARIAALDAAAALGGSGTTLATMKTFEGYSIVSLAENFCSNVPLSTSQDFAPGEPGQPQSTTQLLNQAVTVFDEALSAAPAGSDEAHLAAVGKARALLNLARFDAAAAAVSSVPTDFIWFIEHSDNSGDQENPIVNLQDNGRYSVANGEGNDADVSGVGTAGGNGIAFHHKDGDPSNSAGDPRVPWIEDPAGGFDSSIPLYYNLRYLGLSSDVVLADGVEARLIEAEADIQNMAFGAAETKLNNLRSSVQAIMTARYGNPADHEYPVSSDPADINGAGETLDPLSLPGNVSDAADVLFRERAFWLFNTGHRLGDLRRLMRSPYSRAEDAVYPTGSYFKGGVYGNDVNFWIPFDETNNPNFSIDMCSVTTP